MANPGIQVIVRLKTTQNNILKAIELLDGLIEPTRSNPKNREFRVMQDLNDTTQFTLIEHWEDMEAVKEYGNMQFMLDFSAVKDTIFPISSAEIVEEL